MRGARYQANTGQLSARVNEIPWSWHQRQLKKRVGFLVRTSLTLSSAHMHIVGASRHSDDFPRWSKKKEREK